MLKKNKPPYTNKATLDEMARWASRDEQKLVEIIRNLDSVDEEVRDLIKQIKRAASKDDAQTAWELLGDVKSAFFNSLTLVADLDEMKTSINAHKEMSLRYAKSMRKSLSCLSGKELQEERKHLDVLPDFILEDNERLDRIEGAMHTAQLIKMSVTIANREAGKA